jgi:hypothetical protein
MISFFKSFLLISLICGGYIKNDLTSVKVNCNELGVSFMLPAGFISLDSLQTDALSKRGEKAIKESFNKDALQGWQPGCINLQDSFKRTVLVNVITVKEAIAQDGTTDKFIDNVFKDGNDFIIQRFKRKINIDIDEKETAKQTEITIAGLKVRKNNFTLINGTRVLFFARYYFFQKNEKLFLLTFLGSPRANDNEDIVKAIENAKKI